MNRFIHYAETVTTANEGLATSLEDQSLSALDDEPAVERCLTFLIERNKDKLDKHDPERPRAVRLLFTLAAMRNGDENKIAILRLLGAGGVDAKNLRPASERYRKAGEAFSKKVTNHRHFREHHLPRLQRRLADELYTLTTDMSILEHDIAQNGEIAIVKHF